MSTAPTVTLADQIKNVPDAPLSMAEQHTLTSPTDPWNDHRAKEIARSDFEESERYRMSSGHDQRFRIADELFLGYVPQRNWKGTRIPRSSLGVPISMDQVEALLPVIIDSVFPLRDNVQIFAKPGSTPDEAKAVYDLLMSQFDDPDPETMVSAREPIRQAVKQALIYGNGIVEVYWKYSKIRRKREIAQFVPVTKPVADPVSGEVRQIQTGNMRRLLNTVEYDDEINYPCLKWIDIRDTYVDPNCTGPNLQLARYFAVRSLTTIGELKALRNVRDADGQPLFKIPSDADLVTMADSKTGAYADNLKTAPDTYRMIAAQPQIEFVTNPDLKRLEVIRYFTRDRCVWLFNREWLAYNRENPVGFIPFLNAFYVDVSGRFYGLAVTDVVEGEQRLQQGIVNGRIDELSIILHPPIVSKRGTFLLQSSREMYPGKNIEAENPKEDFIKVEFPGITNNAYIEVDASDRRAQKRTGVTDLGVLGTSSQGGNSAARTATGVNTLQQASGNRITYQVMNLESNFIEPMLAMAHRMNQQFLSPDQILQVLGPEGQNIEIDPMRIKNASVKFIVRAGQKMQSRAMLTQGLPLLMQTFMNPALMMGLSEIGKTPNWEFLSQAVCDAFRLPADSVIRALQPNELQQMMTMRMMPEIFKRQTQGDRLQARSQDVDATNEQRLLHVMLQRLLTPHAADHAMNQMFGVPLPPAPEDNADTQSG